LVEAGVPAVTAACVMMAEARAVAGSASTGGPSTKWIRQKEDDEQVVHRSLAAWR